MRPPDPCDGAAAETAPIRPGEGLDQARLEAWLRPRLASVLPALDGPLEILQFPNGSANLTSPVVAGALTRRPPNSPPRSLTARHT